MIMHLDLIENLFPEFSFMTVHDDGAEHARIDHIKQVIILQVLISLVYRDRLFASSDALFIQRL